MQSKSSVSNASTYQEIGSFWDDHDATEFDVNIKSQRRYFPVDNRLSLKIKDVAKQRGISEETLLNLWIQEKVNQIQS